MTANIAISLIMVFPLALYNGVLALLMAARKRRTATLLWRHLLPNARALIVGLLLLLTSAALVSWSAVSIDLLGIISGFASGFFRGRRVKIVVCEVPGAVRLKPSIGMLFGRPQTFESVPGTVHLQPSFSDWFTSSILLLACGVSLAVMTTALGSGEIHVFGILSYFFSERTAMWWVVARESERLAAPAFLAEARLVGRGA